MNIYRFLAYLAGLALIVVLTMLSALLVVVARGQAMTSDIRNGLWVLLAVALLLFLIVWILLCLARAKDRLKNRKEEYQQAHIDKKLDAILERGTGLGERLAEHFDLPKVDCRGICDVLVRRKFPRKCVEMPIKVTRRPDPCIYSQFFLMATNQPVSWDNKDVEIKLAGDVQDTYNLLANTTYDVTVWISNASPFFDALGTQVQVNRLDFGIGGPTPTPLYAFTKDIPPNTLNHDPAGEETFQWTTPSAAGHYCLQVLITHGNDVNPDNNEGWNNTEVKELAPGEAFIHAIPLWNNLVFDQRGKEKRNAAFRKLNSEIKVDLDSYLLPTLDPATADANAFFQRVPAHWDATVTPINVTLEPMSEQSADVTFKVTVPADATPGTRATFNVTARAGGWPLGGVTIHIDVKS